MGNYTNSPLHNILGILIIIIAMALEIKGVLSVFGIL